MRNQVQLISYADRLGCGNLASLRHLLNTDLKAVFGGIHVLPFFHPIDGADAGFDPIDHTQVDSRLGDWSDVAALAQSVPVMADVIVNHISAQSPQFQDYLRLGSASAYDGLFLTLDTVFPGGATERDLLTLYRPRPGLPFTAVKGAEGRRELMWTTFTPTQIDIDVQHPQGQGYLRSVLRSLAQGGVTMVRLDAIGYAIKQAGTSSFMIAPTFAFIDQFGGQARALGMEVLVEVHAYYLRQIEIAKLVDWVYDFSLPPLLLHAIAFKTSKPLQNWIAIRPKNAITVLDTHDGIGIIDIGADANDPVAHPGLVPPQELDELVEIIHANSRGQSRLATGAAASNLDLYQVNCTYFDALGRDAVAYLIARAVQFFIPGIPQVYYVGLLAGVNDMALLAKTGAGRDINRQYFSLEQIQTALAQDVVQQLLRLIHFRNEHPAFGGSFTSSAADDSVLTLAWRHADSQATLIVDFQALTARLSWTGEAGVETWCLQGP
jgi:sucrose phosphorylase